MFLRLKAYVKLVEDAAAAAALASMLRTDVQKREAEALAARKEVKRLTDVIIHLKDQGKVLPPGAGDEVWGKYVMGAEDAPREGYQGATAEDRELAIGEAEFHADMERALGDEL